VFRLLPDRRAAQEEAIEFAEKCPPRGVARQLLVSPSESLALSEAVDRHDGWPDDLDRISHLFEVTGSRAGMPS